MPIHSIRQPKYSCWRQEYIGSKGDSVLDEEVYFSTSSLGAPYVYEQLSITSILEGSSNISYELR